MLLENPATSATSAKALQTEKLTQTKTVQTLYFNTDYKCVHTLPIQTIHASCQSVNIDTTSVNIMTNLMEEQYQATLTSVSEEKHTQTFMVKVADKSN